MMPSLLARDLPQRVADYARASLRADVVAAVTVSLIVIPQALSYAALVGVSPVYGLYTAIVPALVAALFGSSRFLVTGPTNATALATAGVLLAVASRGDYTEYVFALAVLVGLIKLLLGLLRLGFIIRFVSNSVLTGFLAGAAVLILLNQVGILLGLPRLHTDNAVTTTRELLANLSRVNPYTATTGVLAVMVLWVSQRLDRRLPGPLLAIAVPALAVELAGWRSQGVAVVGDPAMTRAVGLSLHIPEVPPSDLTWLLGGAGAVALLSLVETMSVAKAVAMSSGERLDASREFIGQGLASIAGGFLQCIPPSGSLVRTRLNYSAGAKTRVAAGLSGLLVLMVIMVFWVSIGYVPMASLAAVVIVSAIGLVDVQHLRATWRNRLAARVVVTITFLAVLVAPLHVAIYLGVAVSFILYLYETSTADVTYITVNQGGQFVERTLVELKRERPAVALINIEGALYFGVADNLEEQLDQVLAVGVKAIILRMRRTHLLSSTTTTVLKRLVNNARRAGAHVLICGVTDEIAGALETSGLIRIIGEQQVFKARDVLYSSAYEALARAQELLDEDRRRAQ